MQEAVVPSTSWSWRGYHDGLVLHSRGCIGEGGGGGVDGEGRKFLSNYYFTVLYFYVARPEKNLFSQRLKRI